MRVLPDSSQQLLADNSDPIFDVNQVWDDRRGGLSLDEVWFGVVEADRLGGAAPAQLQGFTDAFV